MAISSVTISVADSTNRVEVIRDDQTHSATFGANGSLTDVSGDPNLLQAVLTAWDGPLTFEISDEDLELRGGGWWSVGD